MTSGYAFFVIMLAFPAILIVIIDKLFLANVRQERVKCAVENGADVEKIVLLAKRPELVEWARTLAPWLLVIFAVRAFVIEPFSIPSTSMLPKLRIGDEIIVNKFAYGLREPLFQRSLVGTGLPQRGDVVVFKNPESPCLDFIKRVIGLPGDRIVYRDKRIWLDAQCQTETDVCQELVEVKQVKIHKSIVDSDGADIQLYEETLGGITYHIGTTESKSDNLEDYFNQRDTYTQEFIVPKKHYFMLGDNRDNSRDSRFFGFVSEEALVGKPSAIWLSITPRDEDSWLPSWIPGGLHFNNVGFIE